MSLLSSGDHPMNVLAKKMDTPMKKGLEEGDEGVDSVVRVS